MSKLAINGGEKVRTRLFPAYKVIGEEEIAAVKNVLESGVLSRFLGTWHEDFYGGPQVRALEAEWAEYFEVKHAIDEFSYIGVIQCYGGSRGWTW